MAELPLAIFTTLAPFGAGAFVMLAISLFAAKLDDAVLRAIDKLTLVPLAVVAVGFVASFFHLASPLNAIGVLSGIGSSPLSNEIAVGVLFFVVALVYSVMAFASKLSGSARKPFAAVVAVLALVFAVFTGMAYMMETIASWNTPLVPVEMIGMSLMGGAAFYAALAAAAGAQDATVARVSFVVALVGFVAALVALVGHYGVLEALDSSFVAGATLAEGVTGYLAGFGVCGVLSVAALGYCAKKPSVPIAALAAVLALVATFLVRFAFYAIQLSIAL